PWLKPELEKVARELHESITDLLSTVRDLQSIADRVQHSSLPAEEKAPLLEGLEQKTLEAQTALDLALNATLEVIAAPSEGPGGASEPEALSSVSPGQRFQVIAKLRNGSKYWLKIGHASLNHADWVRRTHAERAVVAPGEDYSASFLVEVPKNAPITRPYWHRDNPATESVNTIDQPEYETLPLPPPPLYATIDFEVTSKGGELPLAADSLRGKAKPRGTIRSDVEVLYRDEHGGLNRRELAILPVFSIQLEPAQLIVPVARGEATTAKTVAASNLTGASTGLLHLRVPDRWQVDPASAEVKLSKRGEKQDLYFHVHPKDLQEGRAQSEASLDAGGNHYRESYTLVSRPDLGSFYYFEPAVQHVSVVAVNIPPHLNVGYIMGAGDDIATVLQQIGITVTLIPADQVATQNLSRYSTIILGVRAYDTQKSLLENNPKLLDFVSHGGTLIVQNNNSISDFNGARLTPYPAELSRARVSVEDAPVEILAADDPVFHYPNQISAKDFDGWVQERGLYFMDRWDDHFKPLLSCHDPNEPQQRGGLLMAKYGKGTYIYTGYAFFRQLPAGVAGAIRLFVNLVSTGSNEDTLAGGLN
ncbi:MAG: hypothetical protein JOZ02_22835, partial [Acidobacteria bacterium]|nr:hypothetical protein [Acidobacteriota bacterium]